MNRTAKQFGEEGEWDMAVKVEERFRHVKLMNFGWEMPDARRFLRSYIRPHYRIHYITEGRGYMRTPEQVYPLGPGDGFVIFPGQVVNYFSDENDPWGYFWMGIEGESVEELLAIAHLTRASRVFRRKVPEDAFSRIMIDMYTSRISPGLSPNPTEYYLHMLFSSVISLAGKVKSTSAYFEDCLDYIHAHYMESIDIRGLSALLNIDRTYLYKLFKANVGMSPQQYLISYRLSQAETLLIKTNLPVSAVADAAGFSDLSDFYKQFKKRTGFSATEFRTFNRVELGSEYYDDDTAR